MNTSKAPSQLATHIPEFLLAMSKQINEQDNRATSNPIWVVCYDEYLATQDDINEVTYEIYDNDIYGDGPIYRELIDDRDTLMSHLLSHYPSELEAWLEEHEYNQEEEPLKTAMEWIDGVDSFVSELGVDSLTRLPLQKVTREIRYCLTEDDANSFMYRKSHDFPPLYTVVKSMEYCPQMIALRDWIKGLVNV